VSLAMIVRGSRVEPLLLLWTLLSEIALSSLCFMHGVLLFYQDTPGVCLLGVGGLLLFMSGGTKVIITSSL